MGDLAVESETETGGGDHAGELAVAVDGLAAPRPRVDLRVVVVQLELDVHLLHAVLLLLEQRLAPDERDVAVELDAEAPAAFQRRRRGVNVLTPVRVEPFHSTIHNVD